MIKTFILTIDYELFLGDRTGTVEKCMIEPTYRLAEILDKNNSKMTVFWDILHYYRLTELESKYKSLQKDRFLIDDQISYLVSKGHDIQLHIHPHWLDSIYSNGEWKFNYKRFNIHSLKDNDNPENINTIIGCITQSKRLMESVIRKYDTNYKVKTYRAGGYLIEPFFKLIKAFEYNNIFIDSSVLPGMSNKNSVNAYDFINYPEEILFHFSKSPSRSDISGKFLEIPITTIKIPILKNILFALIRLLKYRNLESERTGTGSVDRITIDNKLKINKFISLVTKPKVTSLTTDGNFNEKLIYIFKKAKNNSTVILHPKLLNNHTLNFLERIMVKNHTAFISIKNYLDGKKF
jgi:hypothetical protein